MAALDVPITTGFSFGAADMEISVDRVDTDPGLETEDPVFLQVPQSPAGRRTTVSAEVFRGEVATFQPTTYPKSAAETATLTKVLGSHFLFKHLDDRELAQQIAYFQPRQFSAGDVICEEGESTETSLFHVIAEGMCMVESDREIIATLKPFDTIGETEMMYSLPRTHSVFAQTPVRTFAIDRRTYQLSLHSTFSAKRAMYCDFLRNVNFLQGLSQPEMVQLADCLQPQRFQAGEYLLRCDDPPQCMFIIVEGTVKVVGRDPDGNNVDVCEFNRGAIVGELEFLHEHNNVADVVALSEEVRVARLDRNHFELCMGSLKDMLKASREADPVYGYYNMKRSQSIGYHKDSSAPEEAQEAELEEVASAAVEPPQTPAALDALEVLASPEPSLPQEPDDVIVEAVTEPTNVAGLQATYDAEIGELKYRLQATEQELAQCRRERQNLEVALQEANRICLRVESESLLRIRQLEQELNLRDQEVARLRIAPGVNSPTYSNGLSPGGQPLPPRPSWGSSPSAAAWSPTLGSPGNRPAHACLLPGCRLCHPPAAAAHPAS
eukprot:EG_transcript_5077